VLLLVASLALAQLHTAAAADSCALQLQGLFAFSYNGGEVSCEDATPDFCPPDCKGALSGIPADCLAQAGTPDTVEVNSLEYT